MYKSSSDSNTESFGRDMMTMTLSAALPGTAEAGAADTGCRVGAALTYPVLAIRFVVVLKYAQFLNSF